MIVMIIPAANLKVDDSMEFIDSEYPNPDTYFMHKLQYSKSITQWYPRDKFIIHPKYTHLEMFISRQDDDSGTISVMSTSATVMVMFSTMNAAFDMLENGTLFSFLEKPDA